MAKKKPTPDPAERVRVYLDGDLYRLMLEILAARGTRQFPDVLNELVRPAIVRAHAREVQGRRRPSP